ncbi:TRAP transporter small permease [Roseibium sediminis]|uniref:TRAP transporter small permease n=1 Tax=Roseibium sediminis TaxID=1775174 RepID=UPI00123E245C|nr:TRAP transporter small permease subunit [Roseibium sediminis]
MRNSVATVSDRLNTAVEAVVAFLMLLLVLDVWLGVLDRYYFGWQLPWPEVLARYLMIWAAMLAVSCGIARREHIGLTAFVSLLPKSLRRTLLIAMDVLVLGLFLYVAWFGLGFAQGGIKREAMIFGVSLAPFYAAIPAAAIICSIQQLLVLIRDLGAHLEPDVVTEAA